MVDIVVDAECCLMLQTFLRSHVFILDQSNAASGSAVALQAINLPQYSYGNLGIDQGVKFENASLPPSNPVTTMADVLNLATVTGTCPSEEFTTPSLEAILTSLGIPDCSTGNSRDYEDMSQDLLQYFIPEGPMFGSELSQSNNKPS